MDRSPYRLTFLGNESPYLDLLARLGRLEHVVCEPIGKTAAKYFGSAFSHAEKHGIDIISPMDYLAAPMDTDLVVVAGFGRLIPPRVIASPKIGIVNIHQAYLPAYRGRHPLNWAIINGERQTGVTLHHVDHGLDTGNIILQEKVLVGENDTVMDLHWRTVNTAKTLLARLFPLIGTDAFAGTRQSAGTASYFPPRTPRDGRIAWSANMTTIHNLVRALVYPYPGAYTYRHGRKLVIDAVKAVPLLAGAPTGRPGRVIGRGQQIFIRCGDGFVEIRRARHRLPLAKLFTPTPKEQ